jgi:hypothetical protein
MKTISEHDSYAPRYSVLPENFPFPALLLYPIYLCLCLRFYCMSNDIARLPRILTLSLAFGLRVIPRDQGWFLRPNICSWSSLRAVSLSSLYSYYATQRYQIVSSPQFDHSSESVLQRPSLTLSPHNLKSILTRVEQVHTVRVSSTSSTINTFFPIKSCAPMVLKSSHCVRTTSTPASSSGP